MPPVVGPSERAPEPCTTPQPEKATEQVNTGAMLCEIEALPPKRRRRNPRRGIVRDESSHTEEGVLLVKGKEEPPSKEKKPSNLKGLQNRIPKAIKKTRERGGKSPKNSGFMSAPNPVTSTDAPPRSFSVPTSRNVGGVEVE